MKYISFGDNLPYNQEVHVEFINNILHLKTDTCLIPCSYNLYLIQNFFNIKTFVLNTNIKLKKLYYYGPAYKDNYLTGYNTTSNIIFADIELNDFITKENKCNLFLYWIDNMSKLKDENISKHLLKEIFTSLINTFKIRGNDLIEIYNIAKSSDSIPQKLFCEYFKIIKKDYLGIDDRIQFNEKIEKYKEKYPDLSNKEIKNIIKLEEKGYNFINNGL